MATTQSDNEDEADKEKLRTTTPDDTPFPPIQDHANNSTLATFTHSPANKNPGVHVANNPAQDT